MAKLHKLLVGEAEAGTNLTLAAYSHGEHHHLVLQADLAFPLEKQAQRALQDALKGAAKLFGEPIVWRDETNRIAEEFNQLPDGEEPLPPHTIRI